MATRTGMVHLEDVKQGKVFYEVRHGFVLSGPNQASPQVWPIDRLVVTGRPQKYRTPDGFIWRFDSLKEIITRGAFKDQTIEYSPFLSAAIEYSQTRKLSSDGTATAIFINLKSAQKFAFEFSAATPTERDIAVLKAHIHGSDDFDD